MDIVRIRRVQVIKRMHSRVFPDHLSVVLGTCTNPKISKTERLASMVKGALPSASDAERVFQAHLSRLLSLATHGEREFRGD